MCVPRLFLNLVCRDGQLNVGEDANDPWEGRDNMITTILRIVMCKDKKLEV